MPLFICTPRRGRNISGLKDDNFKLGYRVHPFEYFSTQDKL